MLGLLVRLVVLLSFLIFVGWIVGGLYLDGVVKKGIERVGPEITGTPVSLDRAYISFPMGRGRLKGLVVDNPEGFHTDRAFHLADSRIEFDPLSVFSGTLIIDDQFAPLANKIQAALDGLGGDKPRLILNTHFHGDHTGSNAHFGADGTVIAHDNVRIRLLDAPNVERAARLADGDREPPASILRLMGLR